MVDAYSRHRVAFWAWLIFKWVVEQFSIQQTKYTSKIMPCKNVIQLCEKERLCKLEIEKGFNHKR